MKMNYLFLMMALMGIMGSACTHTHKVTVIKTTPSGKVPPGQAKKATGAKSARAYAPGQQKKRG